MPYIREVDGLGRRRRVVLAKTLATAEDAGELNYQLTMVMLRYLEGHGLSYKTLNDISGAMTEALAEFRRRVIVPYEETKIAENGDLPYNVPSGGGTP